MPDSTAQEDNPGLDAATAARLLKADGFNELPTPDRRGFGRILWEVLRQPMFALLIGGGVVYLLLGDRLEALLLLAFATLSVVITIVQESRSERVLEALRNLASPRALVIRDGKRVQIAGREVVTRDVIVVAEGDRVAADALLLSAQDLLIDESLLTGESAPVRKRLADCAAVMAPVPAIRPSSGLVTEQPRGRATAQSRPAVIEQRRMPPTAQAGAPVPGGEDLPFIFAGTLVVRGFGKARVRATGGRTEMGKIGHALGSIETEQPHLQRQMRWLIRDFAIVGGLAGGLTVLLFGLLRGSWLQALLGGIALGMSLLPEEFPLVMAVFMAMGAWRISRARVLTRRASAIETLGSTTVLCTDKTGTLTENRMTVVAIVNPEDRWDAHAPAALAGKVQETLDAAWLACPREPTDPMDLAIHASVAAHRDAVATDSGSRRLLRAYGLRPDLFAVANVMAGDPGGTGNHSGTKNPGGTGNDAGTKDPGGMATAYAKGALEAIAELCRLSPEGLSTVQAQVEELAKSGVRVLAVASGPAMILKSPDELPETPRGLEFRYLGLVGFADPLRANVPAAVAECRSAGIRVLMITGDYPATARAIGQQAGLDSDALLAGDEIETLSDQALALRVKTTAIFARIRPNQKLRIVESLKADGEVVAMTGDGVNDAPAIKAAHIGIAMGGRGTEVAREASSIVLLDDDFGSIVTTIRLGRRIYDNLRKAIEYIVAVHIPIAGLALLPLLLGLPLMLTPIHIAFLEMIIDPACSMVFEAETEEEDVMRRPPRDPKSSLLLPRRIVWAVLQGAIAFAILAALLIGAARSGMPEGDLRALVFTSLVLINMGLILVNRSFKSSLVSAILRPNRSLWMLLGGVSILLAVADFWPPARKLFHFGQMHWSDLGICAVAGGFSLLVLEALKARWFKVR